MRLLTERVFGICHSARARGLPDNDGRTGRAVCAPNAVPCFRRWWGVRKDASPHRGSGANTPLQEMSTVNHHPFLLGLSAAAFLAVPFCGQVASPSGATDGPPRHEIVMAAQGGALDATVVAQEERVIWTCGRTLVRVHGV